MESISFPAFSNAADKAKYALLLTQARDKNYVIPTGDSLINIAVDYYDAADDIALRAKAHYYRGRVYQDLYDNPLTIREFSIAMPLAEKVRGDELLSLLLVNLGYLFFEQEMFHKADSLYERAEQLNVQRKDSLRLAHTLANRGTNYIGMGKDFYTIAEQYLKESLSIAEKIGSKRAEWSAVSSLSMLYSYLQNGRLAVDYAKRDIALCDTSECGGSYLSLGDAYFKLQQYDSATIYLKMSLCADNYYIKHGAYMRLSDIARARGKLKERLLSWEISLYFTKTLSNCQRRLLRS